MRRLSQYLAIVPLVLAGCDDASEISHVDRLASLELSELWKIQDPRGIPVEIHGTPFRRITDFDLTAALKVPADAPQDISFYVIPAGSAAAGYPWRMILHFNPQGPPNSARDCTLTQEARTNALSEKGFSMNLSVCKETVWQAHGFLQVREIKDGDTAAFTEHFQTLLSAIFRATPNR